jgi:hypothetical protein
LQSSVRRSATFLTRLSSEDSEPCHKSQACEYANMQVTDDVRRELRRGMWILLALPTGSRDAHEVMAARFSDALAAARRCMHATDRRRTEWVPFRLRLDYTSGLAGPRNLRKRAGDMCTPDWEASFLACQPGRNVL